MSNDRRKVTIYRKSEFMGNVVKTEARLFEYGTTEYAQYRDAPFLVYVQKGKRTKKRWVGTSRPYALVVAGWNQPDPDSLFGEMRATGQAGVTAASGRHRC